MNSVHEPGPNGDSETILSRKPGQKLSQVHKTPKLAQPVHQAHPAVVSWLGAGCIVAGTRPYRGRGPGRVVVCMAVSQAPSRPCRSAARPVPPTRARVARLCAYAQRLCRVARAVAVLKYSLAHFPLLPCHNTPGCIVIQPCLLHPFSRNTVNCIAIQFTAYPTSPPIAIHSCCIAIQFVPSQPPL